MQDPAVCVHLRQPEPTRLRHAQAMPKHQEQQAPVADGVAATFGGLQELRDFERNEVFPVVHHFVQYSEVGGGRKPAPLLKGHF